MASCLFVGLWPRVSLCVFILGHENLITRSFTFHFTSRVSSRSQCLAVATCDLGIKMMKCLMMTLGEAAVVCVVAAVVVRMLVLPSVHLSDDALV